MIFLYVSVCACVAGHGGGTRCKRADCKKAAMSSNDVCRIHAEYSSVLSKPKKLPSYKMMRSNDSLIIGTVTDIISGREEGRERGRGRDDNEYDTIHNDSYFVSQEDVFDLGTEHELYFNDDVYHPINVDDNTISFEAGNASVNTSRGDSLQVIGDATTVNKNNRNCINIDIDTTDGFVNDNSSSRGDSGRDSDRNRGFMNDNEMGSIDMNSTTDNNSSSNREGNRDADGSSSESPRDESSVDSVSSDGGDGELFPSQLCKPRKRSRKLEKQDQKSSKAKREKKPVSKAGPSYVDCDGQGQGDREGGGGGGGGGRGGFGRLSIGLGTSVSEAALVCPHELSHRILQQRRLNAQIDENRGLYLNIDQVGGDGVGEDYANNDDLNYFDTSENCDAADPHIEIATSSDKHTNNHASADCNDNSWTGDRKGKVVRNLGHGPGRGLPVSTSFDDVLQALDRIGQPQYFGASSTLNSIGKMMGSSGGSGSSTCGYVSYQSLKSSVFDNAGLGLGLGSSGLGRLGVDISGRGNGLGVTGGIDSSNSSNGGNSRFKHQLGTMCQDTMNSSLHHPQQELSLSSSSSTSTSSLTFQSTIPSARPFSAASFSSYNCLTSQQSAQNPSIIGSSSPFIPSNESSSSSSFSSSPFIGVNNVKGNCMDRNNKNVNDDYLINNDNDYDSNNNNRSNDYSNSNNNRNGTISDTNSDCLIPFTTRSTATAAATAIINSSPYPDHYSQGRGQSEHQGQGQGQRQGYYEGQGQHKKQGQYQELGQGWGQHQVQGRYQGQGQEQGQHTGPRDFVPSYVPRIHDALPLYSDSAGQAPFLHCSLPFSQPREITNNNYNSNYNCNYYNNCINNNNDNHNNISNDNVKINYQKDNINSNRKNYDDSVFRNESQSHGNILPHLLSGSASHQYPSPHPKSLTDPSGPPREVPTASNVLRNQIPKNHVAHKVLHTGGNYHFNSVQALLSTLPLNQSMIMSKRKDELALERSKITDQYDIMTTAKSVLPVSVRNNSNNEGRSLAEVSDIIQHDTDTRYVRTIDERGRDSGGPMSISLQNNTSTEVLTEESLMNATEEIDIMDSSFAADILLTYAAQIYTHDAGADTGTATSSSHAYLAPLDQSNPVFEYQFDELLSDVRAIEDSSR